MPVPSVFPGLPPEFTVPPRIEFRLPPEILFDPRWLVALDVSILVVTDSFSGGYNDTIGFHLGQAMKVLTDDPWSHLRFSVTQAHR